MPLQVLYEAGEKKWGTDEGKFVEILCLLSIPQLRQSEWTARYRSSVCFSTRLSFSMVLTLRGSFFPKAMVEYKTISKKSLQESIEGEMSGDLEDLLVAIGTDHT